jgi:hypothetical protein
MNTVSMKAASSSQADAMRRSRNGARAPRM